MRCRRGTCRFGRNFVATVAIDDEYCARQAQAEPMHSVSDIPDAPSGAQRDLAVGCFGSFYCDRLGDALLAFASRCPDVNVGIHDMPRAALLPALDGGELALAILPGAARPHLESMRLWRDRAMVALPSGHPLAAHASLTPAQLRDAVFLVSRRQQGGDMHRFLSHRIRPLAPVFAGMLLDVGPARLIEHVAEGEGIALVCASEVETTDARVVVRPVDAHGAIFPVCAYWREAEPAWPLSVLLGLLAGSPAIEP
jgi:DNA-binding transcriptional LysR family regulator